MTTWIKNAEIGKNKEIKNAETVPYNAQLKKCGNETKSLCDGLIKTVAQRFYLFHKKFPNY